jgi:hypothetical protein
MANITNGNIEIKLPLGGISVPCTVSLPLVGISGIPQTRLLTSIDLDVIDGKVYGINVVNSGPAVAYGDDASKDVLLGIVDTILQMLGVTIFFGWSSDSADYDYKDDSTDEAFVFEIDHEVNSDAAVINLFASVPGAIITSA